ncbi:MAG: DUF4388 domain-containing protein [Acidobacteriota bacterium]
MKRIVLIEADPARAFALLTTCREVATVTVAPDLLYAFTLLEWDPPDLVVVGVAVDQEDVRAFAKMVREDPALQGMPLAIIGSGSSPPPGIDFRLPAVASAKEMAEELRKILEGVHPSGLRSVQERPEPDPLATREDVLSGSLRVLSLVDLTQALAHARKTGRLRLVFRDGTMGDLMFDDGQVVHGVFSGRTGERAFARLLTESEQDRRTEFRFQPMRRREVFHQPRTINMTVQQLLLTIAVDWDEGHLPGQEAK